MLLPLSPIDQALKPQGTFGAKREARSKIAQVQIFHSTASRPSPFLLRNRGPDTQHIATWRLAMPCRPRIFQGESSQTVARKLADAMPQWQKTCRPRCSFHVTQAWVAAGCESSTASRICRAASATIANRLSIAIRQRTAAWVRIVPCTEPNAACLVRPATTANLRRARI